MNKNLTWLRPSGEWGIEGVDLTALPPAAYGALAKLMRLEHPLREPNPPLTLEELREMDGEPVWVVSQDGRNESCWMLIDVEYKLCREAHGGMAVFENYGDTWLAYRRKPEEADNHG